MTATLLVALFVAVVGPLLTYVGAVRKLSGKIGTSEASELWKESAAMRDDYRRQINDLNRVIAQLRKRLAAVEADNHGLYTKLKELTP